MFHATLSTTGVTTSEYTPGKTSLPTSADMGNEAYLFSDGEDGEDRVMHSTTAVAAAAAVADMDVMASRDVVMNSSEDEDDRLSSMELAVEGLVTATRDENGRSMLGAQDGMAFYHVDPSRQASASPMRPSSLEQRGESCVVSFVYRCRSTRSRATGWPVLNGADAWLSAFTHRNHSIPQQPSRLYPLHRRSDPQTVLL